MSHGHSLRYTVPTRYFLLKVGQHLESFFRHTHVDYLSKETNGYLLPDIVVSNVKTYASCHETDKKCNYTVHLSGNEINVVF